MIEQESDGLSCGDLQEGVMGGHSMKKFVPLPLSVLERAPQLKGWVTSWASALGPVNFLSPQEWYTGPGELDFGKMEGSWVMPPPAAADVAMGLLYEHPQKKPNTSHIFFVPRLMTGCFRKQALKQANVFFSIPLNFKLLDSKMHEPLLMFMFYLSLTGNRGALKGHPSLQSFRAQCLVSGKKVLLGGQGRQLRQFLSQARGWTASENAWCGRYSLAGQMTCFQLMH